MAMAAVPALVGLWLLAGATASPLAILPLAILGYVILQAAGSAIQAAQQTLIPELVDPEVRGRAAGLKSAFDVGGAFLAFALIGALLSRGETISAAIAISVVLVIALALVTRLAPAVERQPRHAEGARLLAIPPGFARLIAARLLFLFGVYVVGRFMLLLVANRLEIPPSRAADETGGLLALFTLVTAGAAIPAGLLADRNGRRSMMVAGAAIAALGVLALAVPAGVPGVIGGGVMMAIGTAAFTAANWAATTDLVPPQEAGRLMGLANIGTGGAAALAGLLGPLIDLAGFTPALLVAGAVTLAAVLPLALPRAATAPGPA